MRSQINILKYRKEKNDFGIVCLSVEEKMFPQQRPLVRRYFVDKQERKENRFDTNVECVNISSHFWTCVLAVMMNCIVKS